jgi:hypothetical protein
MSLVVWLPLNGDLRNQGLSGVTPTNNGATVNSSGKLGKCYTFNGSNSISIPLVVLPSKTPEWSFTCWFKLANITSTAAACLFSERTAGNGNGYTIFIYPNNSNILVDDGARWSFTPTTKFAASTWYHFAVTRTASGKKIYVNGSEIGSTTTVGNTTAINTNGCLVGLAQSSAALTTGNQGWIGDLNDVRVYNNALSESEVKELARGLVLHYPLNNRGFGQENLDNFSSVTSNWTMESLSGSNYSDSSYGNVIKLVTNAANQRMYHNVISTLWQSGQVYTVSFLAKADQNGRTCDMSRSIADFSPTFTLTTQWKRYSGKITSTATPSGGTLSFRVNQSGATVYITQIKLEKGTIATPYCPSSSEALYTTMGLNSTTEYDISGFQNNGTKNNITYTSDTPKYNVSSTFNGTNSYIKVNDNSWMPQGAAEMTVNLWAKATTWPTNGGRLLSCTETGGFNLEAGNSGYWRFPIYVYTNSGQTSSAYKYDSNEIKISELTSNEWNMITLVYNTTGTKTYINGVLHHTYTNTSYGIHFNTNARLFLGCEANTASPSTPYFSGQESDFRIYATALSAEDIAQLYSENKLT